MIFRKILVAGAVVAVSAGAFAEGADATSLPSMHAGHRVQSPGSNGNTGQRMDNMGVRTMSPNSSSTSLTTAESGGSAADLREPTPTFSSPLPPFKKADTNGDGQIEWKEAKADHVPKKFFKKEDYEHNGKLDRVEWQLVGYDVEQAKSGKHKAG